MNELTSNKTKVYYNFNIFHFDFKLIVPIVWKTKELL